MPDAPKKVPDAVAILDRTAPPARSVDLSRCPNYDQVVACSRRPLIPRIGDTTTPARNNQTFRRQKMIYEKARGSFHGELDDPRQFVDTMWTPQDR
jgi:hypothetical protein